MRRSSRRTASGRSRPCPAGARPPLLPDLNPNPLFSHISYSHYASALSGPVALHLISSSFSRLKSHFHTRRCWHC